MCVENNDTFDDVIFSDESTIEIKRHARRCFRKKGELRKMKAVPKHPFKVHVWGGISRRGKTRLVIFKGIMCKVNIFMPFCCIMLVFNSNIFCDMHQTMSLRKRQILFFFSKITAESAKIRKKCIKTKTAISVCPFVRFD